MTTRKPDDKGQADPNAVELTDAELDKASGGILDDDDWRTDPKTGRVMQPKPGVEPSDKPLSGTDLGSGRKK